MDDKTYIHLGTEDFKTWERFYRANFFNSLGGFKSLNLLATSDTEGILNLAPFFSVVHLGANPPLLGLVFRPHTVARHSLENFRSLGFATLNSVHDEIVSEAHQSAANYGKNISEFEAVGLSPLDLGFKVPYVMQSKIGIGVSWQEEHTIAANGCLFVAAAIEEVHIQDREALLEDGFIDHSAINSLAVNALDAYYQAIPYKRFEYPRPEQELKEKKWPRKK